MTTDQLSAAAGIVLSLAFSYAPGLRQWYAGLDPEYKALGMLAALAVTAILALAVSCAGLQQIVTCDQPGAWALVRAFVSASVANQTTYTLTKRIAPVRK